VPTRAEFVQAVAHASLEPDRSQVQSTVLCHQRDKFRETSGAVRREIANVCLRVFCSLKLDSEMRENGLLRLRSQ
jgi:hypothetical protein